MRQNSTENATLQNECVWSLAAFWLVAFVAAGLFAAVLMAPKWQEKRLLWQRVASQAAQCRQLNDSNEHLRRVIEAFKHDPDFTAELARFELDYSQPDEQRFAAPIQHWERPKPQQPAAELDPFWASCLHAFAHDRVVRHVAVIAAAVFMIAGIACFGSTRERRPN